MIPRIRDRGILSVLKGLVLFTSIVYAMPALGSDNSGGGGSSEGGPSGLYNEVPANLTEVDIIVAGGKLIHSLCHPPRHQLTLTCIQAALLAAPSPRD